MYWTSTAQSDTLCEASERQNIQFDSAIDLQLKKKSVIQPWKWQYTDRRIQQLDVIFELHETAKGRANPAQPVISLTAELFMNLT